MPEYWMRSVDFVKVADLLNLIMASSGQWTPSELNRAGIDSGILYTSTGKPFRSTSCYRYRKLLEQLGLIRKQNRKLVPNLNPLERQRMLIRGEPSVLSEDQRYVLATRVVCNPDCYNTFWNAFMPSMRPTSLEQFIKYSTPIIMSPMIGPPKARNSSHITINSRAGDNLIQHGGYNAIQAIHFGLRNWGVGQLGFLDEFYQVGCGYHIFPVNNAHQQAQGTIEKAILEALAFHRNWAMSSISTLLLTVCSGLKVPIEDVRSVLHNWIRAYPNLVMPIAVSNRMVLADQSDKMAPAILKGFLKLDTGEYVSHLQIHYNLKIRLMPRVEKEACIDS